MVFLRSLIICILAFPTITLGNPGTKSPLTLGEVNGESDAQTSSVNIRFNRKPDFGSVSVSSHGSFIQIDLPGTLVPNPGAFIEGNSPYVKKIAIFQLTNKDGAVRLFVSESAAKIQNAMRAEILANRILVTIDHKKLVDRQIATAAAASTPKSNSAVNAEKTTSPADIILGTATVEEAGFATGGIDFRGKLVKISAFIGALLFFAVFALMLKPFLRRRRNKRSAASGEIEEKIPAMSTLATMPIAPKQKLALIQVGDQKILIAIGPDSTTYMTTIGATAPQPAAAAVTASQPSLPMGYGQQSASLSQALAQAQAQQQIQQQMQQQIAHQATPQTQKRAPAASAQPSFENAVAGASDQPQIKLKRRPAAKSAEDSSVATQTSMQKKVRKPKANGASGSRINVAIDDNGVKDLSTATAMRESSSADPKTIEDVTQLIRQKLQAFKAL